MVFMDKSMDNLKMRAYFLVLTDGELHISKHSFEHNCDLSLLKKMTTPVHRSNDVLSMWRSFNIFDRSFWKVMFSLVYLCWLWTGMG